MFNLGKKNGYETNLALIHKNYLMVILPKQFYQVFSFVDVTFKKLQDLILKELKEFFYLYFDSANDSKS